MVVCNFAPQNEQRCKFVKGVKFCTQQKAYSFAPWCEVETLYPEHLLQVLIKCKFVCHLLSMSIGTPLFPFTESKRPWNKF